MNTATSDLSDSYEGDEAVTTNNKPDNIQLTNVIQDIKVLLNKYKNPKYYLNDYLKKVEERMQKDSQLPEDNIDRENIKKYIEKHPYFKNPCNYHIRLITIMKYLKKKGININIHNMDLIVDEIIQEIDGVKKVGEGRYIRNYKGNRKS